MASYPQDNEPQAHMSLQLDRSSLSTPNAFEENNTPYLHSPNNSSPFLTQQEREPVHDVQDSNEKSSKKTRPWWFWALIASAVIAIVVLVVILPVYFTVIKPKNDTSSGGTGNGGNNGGGGSGGGGSGSNPGSPTGSISGGDGSEIIMEDGTKFIYNNSFGGQWVYDPKNPYSDGAQVNSWTPALNATWIWGEDKIFGVNLGGLFVLEPFISPALFQKYPGTIDEWTLSEAMAADTASGGLKQLEDHYNTFITEQDIAEIAGAGLNWVRLPVPYWAIETWPGEPFLAQTSWKYILRVIEWCRKYGIRVKLDLHAIPGSQNGYNHSGKFGQVNFMYGTMGIANAQRALYYIRVFTEFFSQPEYRNVVQIFGIINEALEGRIGESQMKSFYLEVYNMVRGITGIGEGQGPFISIHDGFQGLTQYDDYLTGADRIAYDTHPYFAFGGGPNSEPIATGTGMEAGGQWPLQACNAWGPGINQTQSRAGVTFAGEFSNGYNDCGLFLLGTPNQPVNPECDTLWNNWASWNETTKAGVQAFAEASMDTLQNWFFWTWKIGNSQAGQVEAPLWSYKLGLENGWMPTDPRTVNGRCQALGADVGGWDGKFESWQTGGAGAGTIAPSATEAYTWPPAQISGADVPVSELPVYTASGSVITLAPLPSATGFDGWYNDQDTVLAPTPVPGCEYPNAWDATAAAVPTGCGAGTLVSVTQAA